MCPCSICRSSAEKSSSLMVDLIAGLISMETLWRPKSKVCYTWSFDTCMCVCVCSMGWFDLHGMPVFITLTCCNTCLVTSFKTPILFAEHEDRNLWQHYATLKLPRAGQEEWQHAFTEAPKNWCSFVLNHLVRSLERTPRLLKFQRTSFIIHKQLIRLKSLALCWILGGNVAHLL